MQAEALHIFFEPYSASTCRLSKQWKQWATNHIKATHSFNWLYLFTGGVKAWEISVGRSLQEAWLGVQEMTDTLDPVFMCLLVAKSCVG